MWTDFGIESELYDYKTNKVLSEPYFLRPENIESAYYLYLIQGIKNVFAWGNLISIV
jgi:hypothetical protein